ncbi:hypothetical protein [Actinoplanes sp. NPDC020271]|uniref:hypothetical protein n=1 Tax=Actinoplanes sp. NPDC020271 TaxID=3363896 RepID=UPI003796B2D6
MIIDPPDLRPVDHEFVLVQSELYGGALARMRSEQPDAVVFNGFVSQYVHRPLTVHAGDRVRLWVLDAGPSRASAFFQSCAVLGSALCGNRRAPATANR